MSTHGSVNPYAALRDEQSSGITPPVPKSRKPHRWRNLLILLAVLVAARIALPYVLLHFANKRLESMPNYYGHIADLDLALIRGAYTIDSFHLDKKDTASLKLTPFMSADLIELSVEWKALFDGSLVGELVIEHPELRFTKEAAEPAAALKDTADFRSLLKDFMPLRVNRVQVHQGVVRYRDEGSDPVVDVQMYDVEALVLNLTNSADSVKLLPSSLQATAKVYGGDLTLNMGLAPLADTTRFDLNAELVHTDLTRINDLFQAYGNFDVNKGTFGLYAEMATRDGAFQGYVKPLIKDLDVLGPEDKRDGLFRKLWEALIGTAGGLLKNPGTENVATKVTFEGRLDDPEVGTWGAIARSLHNAFIKALPPSLDNEIDIATVGKEGPEKKGFIQKLFSKDDKKKKPEPKE